MLKRGVDNRPSGPHWQGEAVNSLSKRNSGAPRPDRMQECREREAVLRVIDRNVMLMRKVGAR